MTKATKTENVQTAADISRLIHERGITHIKVGFFDLDGVMAGKYMSAAKFLAALESNYAFCDVVFGWNVNNQLFTTSSCRAGLQATPIWKCACCLNCGANCLWKKTPFWCQARWWGACSLCVHAKY